MTTEKVKKLRKLTAKITFYKLQNKLSSFEFCAKACISHNDFINLQIGNYGKVSDKVIKRVERVVCE